MSPQAPKGRAQPVYDGLRRMQPCNALSLHLVNGLVGARVAQLGGPVRCE